MKRLKIMGICCVIFLLALSLNSISAFAGDEKNADDKEVMSIIEGYFDMMYQSYLTNDIGDFENILDMKVIQNQNKLISLQMVIDNWKQFYEVEETEDSRELLPYSISLLKMEKKASILEVTIDIQYGDPGEAYPMFLASGQNVFQLSCQNGEYLIISHEYSSREWFEGYLEETIPYDSKTYSAKTRNIAITNNLAEQESIDTSNDKIVTRGIVGSEGPYNINRALQYANAFVNKNNPLFAVQTLDCTNFVSQCIAYGFGNGGAYNQMSSYLYTSTWRPHTVSWVGVVELWDYMINPTPGLKPRVRVESGPAIGGIMQLYDPAKGRYSHSVICVARDSRGWKFAQHQAFGYKYFNDYTYASARRYFSPVSIRY